jgi:peptide/nickel transport system substrate-binding protein
MPKRPSRLHWRRRLSQVEGFGTKAEQQIDRNFLGRFNHLLPVRKFVIGWLGLVIVLIVLVLVQVLTLSGYYQVLKTVPGGIYNEGVIGSYTNANPIYATSDSDNTVSSLIFAGLFKTDSSGNLVGDLASGYSMDAAETTYTVHLKPNLKWQDGKLLTAKDVAFTYHLIQNPDAQSPLFSSWQGINVSAPNDSTVVFKLPDRLASFPYNLTTGIVPEHLLQNVPVSDLRSAAFNTTNPIGAGPFAWQGIQIISGDDPQNEQVDIALKPFNGYVDGAPKLDKFEVQIFANQQQLNKAFQNKQLTAMEAVTPPSKQIQNKVGVIKHNFILRAARMVFFKTSTGVLSDSSVRKALVEGSNVPNIINDLGYSTVPVREPLLKGQLAYDPTYLQAGFDPSDANSTLNSDGWTYAKGQQYRSKSNQQLSFTLTASNSAEDQMVTSKLQQDWKKIGVKMNVQSLDPTDFQGALSLHNYDAVLAGISIGVDPDVFVYWDSSQADIRSANRLNLSEYKNATADASLEAGRTRLEPALRVIKYQAFLQAWQQDNPALGLYQPRLLYLTNTKVGGLSNEMLTNPTDRFNNVQNWEIQEAKVTL